MTSKSLLYFGIVFFIVIFSISKRVEGINYEWVGGSGCEEWNTTTSPSCFTPNGFPSPSDSFSLPSNTVYFSSYH